MTARSPSKAPPVSRSERLRLQREREASAKRSNAQRLHRVLREQSEALREGRTRLEDCPELHALIRLARASAQRRVEFCGCVFSHSAMNWASDTYNSYYASSATGIPYGEAHVG